MLGDSQLDLFGKMFRAETDRPSPLMDRELALIKARDRKSLYALRSALHKEIRRNDLNRVVQYARAIKHVKGKGELLRYARQVCFEETRNVELFLRLKKGSSSNELDLVKELATSNKKWHIKSREGFYSLHLKAGAECKLGRLPQVNFKSWLDNPNMLDGYRLWFSSWSSQELRTELIRHCKQVAHGDNVYALLLEGNNGNSLCHYSRKIFIEALFGAFNETWYHSQPSNEVLDQYVPAYEDYVFDNHTSIGISRLKGQGLINCFPMRELPRGVDLRYSGLLRGVLWRELIGREKDTTAIAWKDVVFTKEDWYNSCIADLLYYKDSFDKYRIKYLDPHDYDQEIHR